MLEEKIKKLAAEIFPLIVEIRRKLHRCPELSWEEYQTMNLITDYLDQWGIPYTKGIAKTGICAVIFGKEGGKTVLYRADMDALPVQEETGVSYASEQEGKMHACGHDAHTAMALAVAYILNQCKEAFAGNVKILFQPGEETTGGAEPMISEGVMENPKVDGAFCCHVFPQIPIGKIGVKDGGIMASPDNFEIIIHGAGGHGAVPEQAIDPIVIGSQVVLALQTIVSRRIGPSVPAVVTVGAFHGGTMHNIIPDSVRLMGTMRSADPETRNLLPRLIEEITRGIVQANGAQCHFIFDYLYPPTVCDPGMNQIVKEAAQKMLGNDAVIHVEQCRMTGDDFAYFAERVPSSYFFMGIGNPDKNTEYELHSSQFNIDEDVLLFGPQVLAAAVFDYLEKKDCEENGTES